MMYTDRAGFVPESYIFDSKQIFLIFVLFKDQSIKKAPFPLLKLFGSRHTRKNVSPGSVQCMHIEGRLTFNYEPDVD